METATTTDSCSYAEDETVATSQRMGCRRPTIRDIAAGSSCLVAQRQRHQPKPSSHVPTNPCWFVQDGAEEESPSPSLPHFLDECRMCGRYLDRDQDIFMYMGDKPFCSEECREEQIEIDEARERSRRRRQHAIPANSQTMSNPAAAVAVGAL